MKEKDGIVVHGRPIPGSNLHEFRSRGVVEASLPAVLAVINDTAHAREWNYRTVESRVIERPAPRVALVYNRSGAPWPVADRDVVNRCETVFDPGARQVRVTMRNVDLPSVPPVKGVVRIKSLDGHWFLTAIKGGAATHVEYQMHADAGGSIPDWIANSGSKSVPYTTLMAIREQVRKRSSAAVERELAEDPDVKAVLAAAASAPAAPAPDANH